MGFRSSFNFIPEGEYTVSKDLRDELVRNRFEVGVHDLKHDGWLCYDREHFAESAVRSATSCGNGTLSASAPASCCTTSSGSTTSRPSTMRRPSTPTRLSRNRKAKAPSSRSGSPAATKAPATSSFLHAAAGFHDVPRAQGAHPDIWKRKLDWIAEHGGMALVNVHPDYLDFKSGRRSSTRFPVSLYREFLEYARNRHGDQYWQALPSEVAEHVRKSL